MSPGVSDVVRCVGPDFTVTDSVLSSLFDSVTFFRLNGEADSPGIGGISERRMTKSDLTPQVQPLTLSVASVSKYQVLEHIDSKVTSCKLAPVIKQALMGTSLEFKSRRMLHNEIKMLNFAYLGWSACALSTK